MLSQNRRLRRIARISALACLPIYIGTTAPFLSIPGIFGTVQPIHWSYLWVPALLLSTRDIRQPPGDLLVQIGAALLAWIFTALLLGQLLSDGDILLTLSFYIQILFPALLLIVGMRIGQMEDLWRPLLESLFKGLVVFQLGFCILNARLIMSANTYEIALIFPQFQTYYPGLLALGLCIALFLWPRLHLWTLPYLLSLAFVAPVIWSRIGLTVICLGAMASLAVRARHNSTRGEPPSKFIGALIGGSAAFLFGSFIIQEALSGTLGERLEAKGGNVLQSGRQELMVSAAKLILMRPLLGDAGQPLYDRADFGGTGGLGLRLFPAHSQFLDLGVRGGLPAMILGLFFVAVLCRMAWAAYFQPSPGIHLLLPPVTLVMIAASVSDLYFSQGLTASVGWLLLGLGAGSLRKVRSESSGADSGGGRSLTT